jgi:tight adherence protein C
MIIMIGIGAAMGAVLFAVLVRVAPPGVSALVQLGRLDAIHASGSHRASLQAATPVPGWNVQSWLGGALTRLLTRRGIGYPSLRQDLALTGKTFEETMGRKVVAFVAGFLLTLSSMVALVFAGAVSLPAGSPAVLAVAGGALFFFLPDIDAHTAAARRRTEFRRALGAYLDLVALEMAGSAAPAEALPKAARVGSGWPLALLRDTLFRATRSGRDQWEALTELGIRIGVSELRDLGQLVHLVAHDGARVRQTLTARAATMRRRELAEAEGLAGERDQSMRIAQILIGFGFIVFLGYPAVVNVMNL